MRYGRRRRAAWSSSPAHDVSAPPTCIRPSRYPTRWRLTSPTCKEACDGEIEKLYGSGQHGTGGLYDLILDYPLRGGKALRPALSIAICLGLGGHLEAVLPTAATLELYHNAFLIHDDIEDESWWRRGKPTLHIDHGIPIAVNVGDAMLSLSLQPLLDNVERVGLGPALRILRAVAHMTRQTVEGQAIELEWVRCNTWELDRRGLPEDGGAEDQLVLLHHPAAGRRDRRRRRHRPARAAGRRSAGTSAPPSRSPTTC